MNTPIAGSKKDTHSPKFIIGIVSFLLLHSITDLHGQGRSNAMSMAQSALADIQGLEQEYEKNNERIATLQSNIDEWSMQRSRLYDEERKKLQDKKEEFETSTVWQNRKRSAESGWREHNPGTCGAGGPPPVCPVDHWYRVSVSVALAELDRLKQSELNAIRAHYSRALENLNNKIDAGNDEIAKLRNRNYGIENLELGEKRRELSNAVYDWLEAVRKENAEKEKKWQDARSSEEAYAQILENNLDQLRNRLANSNAEYLDALAGNLRELENEYQNSRNEFSAARSVLNGKLAQSELNESQPIRDALDELARQEREFESYYQDAKQQVNTRLDESFSEREKLLKQMIDDTKNQVGKHKGVREHNDIVRQSELDSWNAGKKAEMSTLQQLCLTGGANCGYITSPLSLMPEADIDVVGSLVKGLPGEEALGEVFGEIYEKITDQKFFEMPTYQVKRTGTQTYFESKMGILPFVSLKSVTENDAASTTTGLDQRLCLEVLGKESCLGVRRNLETGQDEYYISGQIKKNIEEQNRINQEMQDKIDNLIRKTK